jgi:hypothetical protein
MNDRADVFTVADDPGRWLDRLVDGDLNADQQRALLTALENQPDGWRRCALAFIEAQTLRGEFRRMAAADEAANQQLDVREQPSVIFRGVARRHSAMRTLRWLAIAASLLVAFTLGIAAQSWLSAVSVSDQPGKVVSAPAEKTPAVTDEKMVAATANPSSTSAGGSNSESAKWQALKVIFPAADGQGEQTVEVPLVAADEIGRAHV